MRLLDRYSTSLNTMPDDTRKGKILFLELGVGYNTPGIIKYPFWQMTEKNPDATYACVNYGEAVCPEDIREQAICIDGDIGTVIDEVDLISEADQNDIEYARKNKYDEAILIEDGNTVVIHDIKSGFTNRCPISDVCYTE